MKAENFTHTRCMKCREISQIEDLVNNAWTGWKKVGDKVEIVAVPNLCCPYCGSNDLVTRAIGVDRKAA